MAAEKIDALELDINAKLTTENLDKLITALGKLSKALDNVNAKRVKEEVKDTGEASNTATVKVDGLTNSFLNQTIKITALIAVYRRLSGVISDNIESSVSYIKTLNMFNTALGDYATNASKFSETVRGTMGIDIAGWQKAQGIFETLIKGFGVGGEQAAYMSQQLTQLSYDIASYYDLTTEEAQNKIKSALSGRIEPIRKLGWDISQGKLVDIAANPENYGVTTYAIDQETGALVANTQAVDDNTEHKIVNFNQLTQQEKVQLRYIALMTQVTEVQGNMGRTLRDPNNQLRVFREQLEMTGRAFGNIFIPALNEVLPYLTAFFHILEDGFQEVARFFGFEMPDMSDRIGVANEVEYYDDIVEATGEAAKNAKKIKDYTIGLDELNVLRPDTGSGTGGSNTGEQSNLNGLLMPGYDFLTTAIENRIEEAKATLDKLFADWKEKPLELPIDIFVRGAGAIGQGFWEWALGMTPEELRQEAERNGQTIGQAFLNSLFTSPTGGFKDIWVWILGKTPEELKQDAAKNGNTIYDEFFRQAWLASPGGQIAQWIFGKPDEIAQRAREAGRTYSEQFHLEFIKTMLKLFDSNPALQELYKFMTGRDVAHDLAALEAEINDLSDSWNYRSIYGKGDWENNAYKPSKAIEYVSYDEARRRNQKTTPNMSIEYVSYDEARRRGQQTAKSYAQGFSKAADIVSKSATEIFEAAYNGVTANGNAGDWFDNAATDAAKNYADAIKSGRSLAYSAGKALFDSAYEGSSKGGYASTFFYNAGHEASEGFADGLLSEMSKVISSGESLSKAGKSGIESNKDNYTEVAESLATMFAEGLASKAMLKKVYDAGAELSNEGSWGAVAYVDDYEYAGEMVGKGFIEGMREWIDEAEHMGSSLGGAALNALADAIRQGSPSKETHESGMWFTLGFANGIEDYTKKATEAASQMARLSLQAADGFISDRQVSIPTSNVGYGVGAMNEGAMASLASNIYQAIISGISASGIADNDRDVKVIIDGREIFKVVQSEERKNGAKISNGAFSR